MLIQSKKGKMAYIHIEKKNQTGARVIRSKVMMLMPKEREESLNWKIEKKSKYIDKSAS